jgi:hypothetical protein
MKIERQRWMLYALLHEAKPILQESHKELLPTLKKWITRPQLLTWKTIFDQLVTLRQGNAPGVMCSHLMEVCILFNSYEPELLEESFLEVAALLSVKGDHDVDLEDLNTKLEYKKVERLKGELKEIKNCILPGYTEKYDYGDEPRRLARYMHDAEDFTGMKSLATALKTAGCNDDFILKHCQTKKHYCGCFLLEALR